MMPVYCMMKTIMQTGELSVQPLSLQRLYNWYHGSQLQVNRRYQRKLVWSVEEKEQLIDSVVKKLPIPLLLLAQRSRWSGERYEIIDGLQRLDAFFSFMENRFSYNGYYFDLNTIGDTKERLDFNNLTQQEPTMSRKESLAIANYEIPVSIYRDATTSSIDEVFRRINSGGRRLSLHEIRQAGTTGPLPDLVRRVSASIRGDGTFSDSVELNVMDKLSISQKNLDYGLSIESLFWSRHDVLAPGHIRSSGDEELVLDLILDLAISPWPTTSWQNRDVAYGLDRRTRASTLDEVNKNISERGLDIFQSEILATIDLIDRVMDGHESLGRHTIHLETYEKGTRRQFQAIFVALHHLTFVDGMIPKSDEAVRKILKNFWGKGLSIPTGGSAWGKAKKAELYPKVIKKLKRAFFVPEPRPSVISINSRNYVENLLNGKVLEDPLIELKQGFCVLSDPPKENDNLLDEILRTSVAMANFGSDSNGLILIGIADKQSDASRVHTLFGVAPTQLNGHHVVGTEPQITHLGYDVDRWWRRWQQRIESAKIDSSFRQALSRSFRPVYVDNYLLWELRPKSIGKPITFDDRFFVRTGPSTREMSADDFLSYITTTFK